MAKKEAAAVASKASKSPSRGRSATPSKAADGKRSRSGSASSSAAKKAAGAPSATKSKASPSASPRVASKSPSRAAAKSPARSSKAAAGKRAHATSEALNPKTHEFEFMGPYLGGLGIPIFLPLLVWAAAFYCSGKDWPRIPSFLPTLQDFKNSFSWQAMGAYTAWWLFQAFLYLVVPGEMKEGTLLRDGSKLRYPINGWNCLLITAVTAALFHLYVAPLTWIADNFLQLSTAAILFSYALSFYLYFSSFGADKKNKRSEKLLAVGGNSGIALYDFFIGRELNPRVTVPILNKELDLKYFCELRPGLFGWILVNAAMALKQIQTQGSLSIGMVILQLLQALYVADSVYCEDCILTTMDIIQDGFGFMLAFGDLAWVPCLYSLQARYLAAVPVHLSPLQAAGVLALGILGFTIFRKANAQKDTFKKNPEDPSVKDLKFIKTHTGSRLLADGWWGKSRHINYFGDWLLSVAMSLPCAFGTPVPYFYPFYFAILLIHREMRDEHKCAAKYGEAWKEYRRQVPYHIIPYVY